MFTINIYLKFALIAIGLVGGTILAFTVSFWYALPFLLMGIIMLATYLLLGTVQSSAQLVQATDFVAAEKRLNLTFKPEWLYVTNRAFFYLMKATLAGNKKDHDEAEMWLKKAEQMDLPSDNEKAMVYMQLASIYANRGKIKSAENYMREVKKLNVTEPQMKMQIEHFDRMMQQNQSQMNMSRRMSPKSSGMMRPGGKRRRPKMR